MNVVFSEDSLYNVHISDEKVLLTPAELKQEFSEQPFSEMQYGQSITDACIDWPTTEALLTDFAAQLEL